MRPLRCNVMLEVNDGALRVQNRASAILTQVSPFVIHITFIRLKKFYPDGMLAYADACVGSLLSHGRAT